MIREAYVFLSVIPFAILCFSLGLWNTIESRKFRKKLREDHERWRDEFIKMKDKK